MIFIKILWLVGAHRLFKFSSSAKLAGAFLALPALYVSLLELLWGEPGQGRFALLLLFPLLYFAVAWGFFYLLDCLDGVFAFLLIVLASALYILF